MLKFVGYSGEILQFVGYSGVKKHQKRSFEAIFRVFDLLSIPHLYPTKAHFLWANLGKKPIYLGRAHFFDLPEYPTFAFFRNKTGQKPIFSYQTWA